jgi:hypothetical protein
MNKKLNKKRHDKTVVVLVPVRVKVNSKRKTPSKN